MLIAPWLAVVSPARSAGALLKVVDHDQNPDVEIPCRVVENLE